MGKHHKHAELDRSSNAFQLNISQDQLDEKIKKVAQGIYEKKGHVSGHDLDDWLEAEKIVKKSRV